jgi:hypothetical protein
MKKKALFSIVAIALFAVAMAFNSQKDKNEDLTVKNIEALAFGWAEGLSPDTPAEGNCSCSGGEGATACSCSSGIASVTSSCSVSCGSGYYACCNVGPTCTCVSKG